LMTEAAYAKRHHELLAPEPQMVLESHLGIDTLYWAERDFAPLTDESVKIRILATALNFRDVLKSMHLYPGNAGDFGYECVGEVLDVGPQVKLFKPGDKIIVMGEGLLAGETVIREVQAALLPSYLTPEEGASIPIVFLTANYGLNQLAKIKKGQRVLIHAASGGVGLAAIQLARLKGAEVYATASQSKQPYLREVLGIEHVYDSRSLAFGEQILRDTRGLGIDVVLNSLTGEGFIATSLSCLKKGGVFLEIGKINVYSEIDMATARPDLAYHLIEIDQRMKEDPEVIQHELQSILALFSKGELSPLPMTVYPVTQAMAAFHYLQQSKHIGKVVLNRPMPFRYQPDASYLITGGTGGLGLELAKHLIDQGVKYIALTSRSVLSEAVTEWISNQQSNGIIITHYQADVADKKALKKVLKDLVKIDYPLKGIFHAAGLIQDGLLSQLSEADFEAVLSPKVQGSLNLDELSQGLNLDCFVLFSSVSSLFGNAGQSNYSAANAFMDGLAVQRRSKGLVATSIHWGAFGGVGMAKGLEDVYRSTGMIPLLAESAFGVLDDLLTTRHPEITVMSMDWSRSNLYNNPYFNALVSKKTISQGEFQGTPEVKQERILSNQINQVLAKILNNTADESMDSHQGFLELGMDSLKMIEFKNSLQHWVNMNKSKSLSYGEVVHPLLGSKLPGHSKEIRFIHRLDVDDLPYLKDHRVYDHIVFPGAGFIESALASGVQVFGEVPIQIKQLSLHLPLELNEIKDYEVSLLPDGSGYKGLIEANKQTNWVNHVEFSLSQIVHPNRHVVDLEPLKHTMQVINRLDLYSRFNTMGLSYGDAFQSIQEAFVNQDKAFVLIKNELIDPEDYYLHPTLLDGVFQAVALIIDRENLTTYIPSTIEQMDWYDRVSGLIWAEVTLVHEAADAVTADMKIFNHDGVLCANINGFVARLVT
jgi:NADPH:quinone reductase-like Zn-dependent oxidoreductase/NADP-dependent 3-hydroxy acid dehydrogenase YdfG